MVDEVAIIEAPLVEIFTDGACSPNPGIGGWGAILISPAHNNFRRELFGAALDTTNNRMELTSAIEGLRALKRPCHVKLTTDSQYLSEAFSGGWLGKWRRNGWRTANRKPVRNADLWHELLRLVEIHKVEWVWVKGHSDHPENTRADQLAVEAREQLRNSLQSRGR